MVSGDSVLAKSSRLKIHTPLAQHVFHWEFTGWIHLQNLPEPLYQVNHDGKGKTGSVSAIRGQVKTEAGLLGPRS